MRRVIGVLLTLVLTSACGRADRLLAQMTLDEKIGQMTQVKITYPARRHYPLLSVPS
jgi:hypothetical protein